MMPTPSKPSKGTTSPIALSLIAVCLTLAAVSPALSQGRYPTRPITVVVPFPAGGPSDVVARIVAESMSKALGQQMVIENVGGAGGTIGSARVAAAAPDGYTLLAGSMGSHVSAPVLTPGIKYNSERDFTPIGFTAHAPAVVVARKDFPAKNLKEFVQYAKKNASKMKQGHGGIGASSHMACFLFNSIIKVDPISVAYRGSAPALNDVVAGHVDYLCEQAVSVTGAITGDQVKALAISSSQRLPTLPNVPTAKESGVNYDMSIWAGIFAPKGTPKPIVDRLAGALSKALDDPGVQKRLGDLGGSIPSQAERTPAKFESYVAAQIAHWSPILKAATKTAD
jgi:tripartite-type tricarboxylate transporter receptor subunit TctC